MTFIMEFLAQSYRPVVVVPVILSLDIIAILRDYLRSLKTLQIINAL